MVEGAGDVGAEEGEGVCVWMLWVDKVVEDGEGGSLLPAVVVFVRVQGLAWGDLVGDNGQAA